MAKQHDVVKVVRQGLGAAELGPSARATVRIVNR